MQEDNTALEKLVLIELMRLNGQSLGLTLGVLTGFGVFGATIFLLLKGGEQVGPNLALLGQFFIGYEVTYVGSVIGFLYGLLFGYLVGYVIALLYNWMASAREKRRSGKR